MAALKIDCDCRKPKPGMLLRASNDFNIDLSKSWMVGDGKNDVLAGKNAGCKTVRIVDQAVDTGMDNDADLTAHDLLEAIKMILFRHKLAHLDEGIVLFCESIVFLFSLVIHQEKC